MLKIKMLFISLVTFTTFLFSSTQAITNYSPIVMSDGVPIFVPIEKKSKIFMFNDGIHGVEPWITDGTTEGTHLVKEISPDEDFAYISSGIYYHNSYYFVLSGGSSLWKSDGSASGTVKIKENIEAGDFIVKNDTLFFSVGGYYNPTSLWKTDGTEEGTMMVVDNIGNGISSITVINNTLYFMVFREWGKQYGEPDKYELWKSDGSTVGTKKIINLESQYIIRLKTLNNMLYFVVNDTLWKSNGTTKGTYDTKINISNADEKGFYIFKNHIYIVNVEAKNVDGRYEGSDSVLLKSDGTKAGTTIFKKFDSYVSIVGVSENYIYFLSSQPGKNDSLWKTDGTIKNTILVKKEIILDDYYDPIYTNFMTLNNNLFFHSAQYTGLSYENYGLMLNGANHYDYDIGKEKSYQVVEQFLLNGELFFILRNWGSKDLIFKSNTKETKKLLP